MDLCLLTRYDLKLGQMFSMIYVDDGAIFGTKDGREWTKREVRKEFNIKENDLIHDYLCITMIRTPSRYLLHQQNTIDRMERLFGPSVNNLRSFNTYDTWLYCCMTQRR